MVRKTAFALRAIAAAGCGGRNSLSLIAGLVFTGLSGRVACRRAMIGRVRGQRGNSERVCHEAGWAAMSGLSGQSAPATRRNVIRWLFEGRDSGRIVIAQAPNALMWLVLLALAAGFFFNAGRLAMAIRFVLFGSLLFWALDEITRGVNPWRRFLGFGTIVAMIAWFIVLKR